MSAVIIITVFPPSNLTGLSNIQFSNVLEIISRVKFSDFQESLITFFPQIFGSDNTFV